MVTVSSRKAQIAATAARMFSKRGYHATTMRELAAALDMEGGSLYGHISGKYDLLRTIVLDASSQFRAAAADVLASPAPPDAQLRDLMRRHLAIVASSVDRAVVFHHEWKHLDADDRALLSRHRDEYEQAFRQIIRSGIASGAFAVTDERLTTLGILSLLNWTYHWYRTDGPLDASALADQYYALAMDGMAPR